LSNSSGCLSELQLDAASLRLLVVLRARASVDTLIDALSLGRITSVLMEAFSLFDEEGALLRAALRAFASCLTLCVPAFAKLKGHFYTDKESAATMQVR